jgi:hypothetical protein
LGFWRINRWLASSKSKCLYKNGDTNFIPLRNYKIYQEHLRLVYCAYNVQARLYIAVLDDLSDQMYISSQVIICTQNQKGIILLKIKSYPFELKVIWQQSKEVVELGMKL